MPAERTIGINRAKPVLELMVSHLAGEMAAKNGNIDEAERRLGQAAAQEDELQYEEPPAWYMPIRQRLGAVLLAAGRAKQAEKAFREDLVRRPANGWSLHGLSSSLKSQGRAPEAAKVEEQFKSAWKSADVQLAGM
jgi:hypothetical protein